MKKILALLLALAMLLSFAACGDSDEKKNNTSSPAVEKNTVDIVNNAYAATAKVLKDAKAIGYNGTIVKSATVDGNTVSARMGFDIEYLDTDKGRIFGCKMVAKSGDMSEEKQLYDDTENLYGYKAGTTYLLSDNKETKEVVEGLFKDIEFMDATKITVLSTKIVDTVGEGHGFVLEYDFNDEDFDPEEVIGTDLFNEKQLGLDVKMTGLRISGIVDSEGRLTSQKVTFEYSYEIEVEQVKEDVDPDNSDAVTVEKVKKTATNVITAEFNFDYDVVEVDVPDLITVMGSDGEGEGEGEGEGDEKPKKPEEISMTDFMKSVTAEPDDDADGKKSDKD